MSSGEPWIPPIRDVQDVNAIKALVAGVASDVQQKRALDYIIRVICGTYDLSWRPEKFGGSRGTDFAEGKRFVGLQIVKMINDSGDKNDR